MDVDAAGTLVMPTPVTRSHLLTMHTLLYNEGRDREARKSALTDKESNTTQVIN